MSFFERRFAPIGNSFMREDPPTKYGVRSSSVPAYARLLLAAHADSQPELLAATSAAVASDGADADPCGPASEKDRQLAWPDTDSEAEWEAPRPRRAKTYDIATCQKQAVFCLGSRADSGSTLSTTATLDISSLTSRQDVVGLGAMTCADDSEDGLRKPIGGTQTSQVIELSRYLGNASDDLGDSRASSSSSQSASSCVTQLLGSSASSSSSNSTPRHFHGIVDNSRSAQTRSSQSVFVLACIPMAAPKPLLASCPAASPAAAGLHADHVGDTEGQGVSTVMIRNLPSTLSQQQLLEGLNRCGFAACYDFCYMPCNFQTEENQGIAFVNFTSPAKASELLRSWHRARPLGSTTSPELSVAPAAVQGLEANLRALGSRLKRIRNPKLRPFVCSAALSPSKPQEQLRPGQSALPVTPGLQARPTGPRQHKQQNHQRQQPRRLALAAATATTAGSPQAPTRRRTTPAGERVIVA